MKIRIIVIVFLIIIVVSGVSFFIYKKIDKRNECEFFSGGSFNVIFNTNGGDEIPSMHVGIACSPDSYEDLPSPTREGYDFAGWYYDSDFKKKVDFTNSIDFIPIPEYDKNKCIIGHKDIEIYAKWRKLK